MDISILSFPHSIPRNFNKRVVLDYIRFANGGISRAELARRMAISRAAVSGIVSDLMAMDLLREAQVSTASIGRRPFMLEINPQRGYVLGIDLGITHLEILLADFSARIFASTRLEIDIQSGPAACLRVIDQQVDRLLSGQGMRLAQVHAAVIGVPGPVLTTPGTVRQPPLMPGWDQFPIRTHLQDLWELPVSVANDAELGALGEWAYGAAQEENNLVYIKAGSGIGAGLLLNGRIYHGESGAAGEIGHITVQEPGSLCTCGNYGCLETIAGGNAILRRAFEAARIAPDSKLAEYLSAGNASALQVAQAAAEGDPAALQIITEAGTCIGVAVASLINLINPGLVVIGGGLAQIGEPLLGPIRFTVQQRCLSAAAETVRIETAGLGLRSTSMGAVAQALDIALHLLMEA